MTEGDNRNVMAAQLAVEALGAQPGDREDQRPAPGRAPMPTWASPRSAGRTSWPTRSTTSSASTSTFGPGIPPATGAHPGGEHHASAAIGAGGDGAAAGPAARGAAAGSGRDPSPAVVRRQPSDPAPSRRSPPGRADPCSCSSSAAARSATT